MKKILFFIILFTLLTNSIFSEETSRPSDIIDNIQTDNITDITKINGPELNINTNHGYEWFLGISTGTVRKLNLSIGLELGVNKYLSEDVTYGIYLHNEFFLKPLGSSTNALARYENEFDFGMNIGTYIYKNETMKIKISADIGYYMQFIKFNQSISNQIYLGYNGGIIRPMIFFEFYKVFSSPIGIAITLNNTSIIPYSDYENMSLMFVI